MRDDENTGYVWLWRKLLDSQVWNNPCLLKVWIWCLLKANHEPAWVPFSTGRGKSEIFIEEGQFIFGRKTAAKELKMKESTIQKRMLKLKSIGNLIMQSNTHCSIVTICNWSKYQSNKNKSITQSIMQVSGKYQASITNNNVKNVNNEKKETIYIPIFDFWNSKEIIVHRKLTDKMKRKINGALKDRTQDEIIKAIENYATVLKSSDYYFTHEWTLEDFLLKGLDRFLDEAHPLVNFLDKNNMKQKESSERDEYVKQLLNKKKGKENDN